MPMPTVSLKPSYEVREIIGESRVEIKVKEGTTVKGLLTELVERLRLSTEGEPASNFSTKASEVDVVPLYVLSYALFDVGKSVDRVIPVTMISQYLATSRSAPPSP